MSRTLKQSPAPGKEFWTARPGNRHGQPLGKFSKIKTYGAERRIGKFIAAIEKAHLDAEHSTLHFGPAAPAPGTDELEQCRESLKLAWRDCLDCEKKDDWLRGTDNCRHCEADPARPLWERRVEDSR